VRLLLERPRDLAATFENSLGGVDIQGGAVQPDSLSKRDGFTAKLGVPIEKVLLHRQDLRERAYVMALRKGAKAVSIRTSKAVPIAGTLRRKINANTPRNPMRR